MTLLLAILIPVAFVHVLALALCRIAREDDE